MATVPEVDAPDAEILEWLRREYDVPFEGWDFSYLEGRRIRLVDPPWDYAEILVRLLPACSSVLEIDTGGGERMAAMLERSGFKGKAIATEGYKPNVALARDRLGPLGVEVVHLESPKSLPFEDGTFDLVMNRHGLYTASEEFRVLRPGGAFVTEQVGHMTNRAIRALFGYPAHEVGSMSHLAGARSVAEEVGFDTAQAAEAYPPYRYTDVGALVYYLKAISWEISDFSVDRYASELLALHRRIRGTETGFLSALHIFFLALLKPGGDGRIVL